MTEHQNIEAEKSGGAGQGPGDECSSIPRSGSCGWFKATRGYDTLELIQENPNAYALAAVIAHRARWREGLSLDGLEHGDALLGDYREYGMTRQQYRTALEQLVKWKFATIKTTCKGTIARLVDTRLFDPLNVSASHPINHPATNGQPSPNHQTTTESLSENCKGCCGEGFCPWPRRRDRNIPKAGCDGRANAGHGQKTRRPEGFRAKGRLASLLLSRRSTRDILLRRASPAGLLRESSTPWNFQTGSYEEGKKEKKEIKNDINRNSLVSLKMTPEGRRIVEVMERCREVLGPKEWNLYHKRWYDRAVLDSDKLMRVLNDTACMAKENDLKNPAAWAETLWNRVFK